MARKVKPLRRRAMTLIQLQMQTLDVLRKVRFQFNRQAHESGMSDTEFLSQIVEPLEIAIYEDRHVAKMKRNKA